MTLPTVSISESEVPDYNPRVTPAWTLLYEDLPEPEWLIEGWIPKGAAQRIMFGGAPKAKKSTLAFELAVSLASHSKFLGRYPVTSGETYNVLYVQEENSAASMRRDIGAILTARGMAKIDNVNFNLPPEAKVQWASEYEYDLKKLDMLIHQRFRLNDPDHLTWLEQSIKENQYSYVFLDSLYRIVPGADLDKGWQTSQVLDVLDHLRINTQASIVVIHHAGKTRSGGSAGDKLMHSTYLRAWYDCLVFPSTMKNGDTEVLIEAREFEEPEPHYLRQLTRGEWTEGELPPTKADERGSRHDRLGTIFDNDAELRNRVSNGQKTFAIDRLHELTPLGGWGVADGTLWADLKQMMERHT